MGKDDQNEKDRKVLLKDRVKIRRMFSDQAEVRADAFEAMEDAWAYHEANFRVDELATMPLENCAVMAAKREAYKEVIDWLKKL